MWGLPAIVIRHDRPTMQFGTCRMTELRASVLDRFKKTLLPRYHLLSRAQYLCSWSSSPNFVSVVKSEYDPSASGYPVSCRDSSGYLWREPQLPQSIPPSSELGSIRTQSQQAQRWRSSSDVESEFHTWGCFGRSLSQLCHSMDEVRSDAG